MANSTTSTETELQEHLFKLIAYCREQRVAKIKMDGVEIEFSQLAYAAEIPMPEETIEQREARLQREQKEQDELLYYSSKP